MKKILLAATIILSVILLSGCLYTLHPIFTVKDLVFDQRLLGRWQTKQDKDSSFYLFEKASVHDLKEFSPALQQNATKIYRVTRITNESENYFGFLVKLGNGYFIDLYPDESGTLKNIDKFFKLHIVKQHSIYKIEFLSNHSFELKQFDDGYMRQLVDNKQIRIKHELMDDGSYLITAPTEELQQYIIKYGDVPDAYYKDGIAIYKKIY